MTFYNRKLVFILAIGLMFTLGSIAWARTCGGAEAAGQSINTLPDTLAPDVRTLGPTDGPTYHSGTLSNDETWAYADEPHILTADVTVPSTVTLTIEPGVSVLAESYHSLNIGGHLDAQGTESQRITFNWLQTMPTPTHSGGIRFSGGSGHLRYVTVSNARHQSYPCAICIHNVDQPGEQVLMEYVTVTDNPDHGVEIFGSRVEIHSCTFSHNGNSLDDAGLYVGGTLYQNDDPTLGALVQYSHFDDNAGYGIYTDQGARLTLLFANSAQGNGAYPVRTQAHNLDDVLNGGNSFHDNTLNYLLIDQHDEDDGQEWGIAADVVFNHDNGLEGYELENDVTVAVTGTLSIEDGLVVRSRAGAGLTVEGHLVVSGTASHGVTFTSAQPVKDLDDWDGIAFSGGTGRLRYATVSYARNRGYPGAICVHNVNEPGELVALEHVTVTQNADNGIWVFDGRVSLADSLVSDNGNSLDDAGLDMTGGEAIVQDSSFDDNAGYGIQTSSGARLTLLGANRAEGNSGYPLRTEVHNLGTILTGQNSLGGNVTDHMLLSQHGSGNADEWAIGGDIVLNNSNGLTGYELEDTVTITASGTVTVEDGLEILGHSGAVLQVNGHLAALGTADHGVLFSAQNGTPGGWGGISFWGRANRGTGYLRHTTVEYGQGSQRCNLCVIHTTAGEVILEHARLSGALDHGLNAMNSHVVLRDTVITNNGSANGYPALNITWGSVVTATRTQVDDNDGWGVSVDGDDAAFHMVGGSIGGNHDDGLRIYNGSPTVVISQTEIVSNTGHGVDFDGTGGTTLRYCRIYDNGGLGVRNQNTSVCLDVTGNWWGDAAGPHDPSDADDGCMGAVSNVSAGEGVSDDVRYAPWVGGVTTMTLASETLSASLAYTDAHGLTTRIAIPAGALTETTVLIYTPLPAPSYAISDRLTFGGWAFDVAAHGGGEERGNLTAPVTVTLHYSIAAHTLDEASLRLYRWTGADWQDVAETCSPPSSYRRDPDTNQLRVQMCHLSEFALLGEAAPAAVSIAKSVTPEGQVDYGDALTYTLVISAAPGTHIGLYDPLTETTFLRFVEPRPTGVIHAGHTVTGTLEVMPTNQVTISFVAQVNVPGTLGGTASVSNRACIYPGGGTVTENCIWSNIVTNETFHPYAIFLPLVLRNH